MAHNGGLTGEQEVERLQSLWKGTKATFERLVRDGKIIKDRIYYVGDSNSDEKGFAGSKKGQIFVGTGPKTYVEFACAGGEKGEKGDKGDKGDPGETPDLSPIYEELDETTKRTEVVAWNRSPYDRRYVEGWYQKIATFDVGTQVVLNVTSSVFGSPNQNTIWMSAQASANLITLLDWEFCVKINKSRNEFSLYIPALKYSTPAVGSYTFQVVHEYNPKGTTGKRWHTDYTFEALTTPDPAKVIYRPAPPSAEESRTFFVNNGIGSVSLDGVSDFIGKVKQGETARVKVSDEALDRTYRFTFDKAMEKVEWQRETDGLKFCEATGILQGEVLTLTSARNEENGWLVSRTKPSIISMDGSVQIEWLDGGVANLKVIGGGGSKDNEPTMTIRISKNTLQEEADKDTAGKQQFYISLPSFDKSEFSKMTDAYEAGARHATLTILDKETGQKLIEMRCNLSATYDYYYAYDEEGNSVRYSYPYEVLISRMPREYKNLFDSEWTESSYYYEWRIEARSYYTRQDATLSMQRFYSAYNEIAQGNYQPRLFAGENIKIDEFERISSHQDVGKTYECDDVAFYLSGGVFRLPTKAEVEELLANTTNRASRSGRYYGRVFTSIADSGKNFFLQGGQTMYEETHWMTGDIQENDVVAYLKTSYEDVAIDTSLRYYGYSILGVSESEGQDLGLPSGLRWSVISTKKYAWGEIETKETFSFGNYKWAYSNTAKRISEYTKYNQHDGMKTLTKEVIATTDRLEYDKGSGALDLLDEQGTRYRVGAKHIYKITDTENPYHVPVNADIVWLDRSDYSSSKTTTIEVFLPYKVEPGKEIKILNSAYHTASDQAITLRVRAKVGNNIADKIIVDIPNGQHKSLIFNGEENDNQGGWTFG